MYQKIKCKKIILNDIDYDRAFELINEFIREHDITIERFNHELIAADNESGWIIDISLFYYD